MKTIIICLLIILIFSGYMAFTSDNKSLLPVNPELKHQTNAQTNNDYAIEIIEEEEVYE